MKNKPRTRLSRVMQWIWPMLSVGMMVLLFYSSSMPGDDSGAASMGIIDRLKNALPPLRLFDADTLHFLLRKGAHFTSYFVLAFFTTHAFKYYLWQPRLPRVESAAKPSPWKLFFVAWGIASLYGVADEIHQYFVPGRACLFSDMMINAAGALFGAGLVVLYLMRRYSHRME